MSTPNDPGSLSPDQRELLDVLEQLGRLPLPVEEEEFLPLSEQALDLLEARGLAAVQVLNNTVTGPRGHLDSIAQNGIVILSSASALIKGNTISGNWYTPKTTVGCGLLFIEASGVKQQSNSFSDNEMNLCNVGRGGGSYNP